jgi:hypothetical protein
MSAQLLYRETDAITTKRKEKKERGWEGLSHHIMPPPSRALSPVLSDAGASR